MTTLVTSAPAKVILFGEHGVNRHQPALATAVDLRTFCHVTTTADPAYELSSGSRQTTESRGSLLDFKRQIDTLRAAEALDELRARTRQDFFAPARYVLAHVLERWELPGLTIRWSSDLPIGSGLGSGAAANGALALAALRLAGQDPTPADVAWLAWQGDVIAHGGVASGLDSGASALGGLSCYTLAEGPRALPSPPALPLVVGDTRVSANTGEVNTRVRATLATHPARMQLFASIGLIVRQARPALEAGDLETVGQLMSLNQLLLEKLGVSSPEIERLVDAAIEAGALGAKLSGSGGGGIIVALARPGEEAAIAAAIDAAGGRSILVRAGAGCPVGGVRVEPEERSAAL